MIHDSFAHRPRIVGSARRRRGGMYIAVLSTSLLVVVMGLGALLAARTRFEAATADRDGFAARWYAQSAIELGLLYMRGHPDWRTNPGQGGWVVKQPIGIGVASLTVSEVADGDADPLNNDWVLLGVGTAGNATRKIELLVKGGATPSSLRRVTD